MAFSATANSFSWNADLLCVHMPPASVSRPRRASAQRTAEKISSSLKAESGAIPEREPKPERKTKRRLASGDAGPVPKVKREKPSSAPNSSAPKVKQEKPSSAPKSSAPKVKQAKPGKAKASAAPACGGGGGGDVLLGHFISKCVGIQHYRGNGVRYNKEPLQLRRDPNNPYDCNAVAVHTVAGKMVGHMQRVDALAVARVADDSRMRIRMVAQVETRAGQTYSFPLRVSFFGPSSVAGAVATHLAYTAPSANHFGRQQMGGGIVLIEPKPRGGRGGSRGGGGGRGGARSGGAARSSSSSSASASSAAAAPAAPAPAAEPEPEEDEVEFAGERTWEERNAELLKHAIVLE